MKALFSRDVKLANEAIRKYFEDLEFGESELVDQLRYKSIKCDVNVLCPNFTQFIWSMKRQAELSAEIAEIIIDMNVKLSRDMVSVESANLKGLMMAQS